MINYWKLVDMLYRGSYNLKCSLTSVPYCMQKCMRYNYNKNVVTYMYAFNDSSYVA